MHLPAAIGLFTRLPSRPRDIDRALAGRALRAFPLVGLIIGVLAGGVGALAAWWGRPVIGAVAVLAILAWATGALHLDGIADTADGLGSRQPPEKALEIMRRSDVGPMGVAALVLVLFLQFAALTSMGGPFGLLAAVIGGAVVSRAVCVLASTRLLPSARASGFGALFHDTVSPLAAAGIGLLSVVGATALGVILLAGRESWMLDAITRPGLAFVAAGLTAFVVGMSAAKRFTTRLGGMTGDTFGAVIEVSVTAYWLVLAFAS